MTQKSFDLALLVPDADPTVGQTLKVKVGGDDFETEFGDVAGSASNFATAAEIIAGNGLTKTISPEEMANASTTNWIPAQGNPEGRYVRLGPTGIIDTAILPAENIPAIMFFDDKKKYTAGEIVTFGGGLFRAPGDIPAGAWDATKWVDILATAGKIVAAYDPTHTYALHDLVVAPDGNVYHALRPTTGTWDATAWRAFYVIHAATDQVLGGVRATANPGGEFVNGIEADGDLIFAALPLPTETTPGVVMANLGGLGQFVVGIDETTGELQFDDLPFATEEQVQDGTDVDTLVSPSTLRAATADRSSGVDDGGKIVRLDAGGRIDATMLSLSAVEFKGVISPTTPAPTDPIRGDLYYIDGAGTVDSSWGVTAGAVARTGDQLIYDGAAWKFISGSLAENLNGVTVHRDTAGYKANDLVSRNGHIYRCHVDIPPKAWLSTDWDDITTEYDVIRAWEPAESYAAGKLVVNDSVIYRAKSGGAPPALSFDPTKWAPLVPPTGVTPHDPTVLYEKDALVSRNGHIYRAKNRTAAAPWDAAAWFDITAQYGAIHLGEQEIVEDFTIPVGMNAGTFGDVAIKVGVTVDVSPGSTWTII